MDAGWAKEHRTFEEMAVAHVLGGLADERARVFRAHLLECADCRARVGELRAIAHELADVERDERRQRAAKAVDTKRRAGEGGPPASPPDRPLWPARILLLAAFGLLLGLAAWNFMMRVSVSELEDRLDDQRLAAAALEWGEPLTVAYTAPGIEGTAKKADRNLVLLLDGLTPSGVVGVYALSEVGDDTRSVFQRPYELDSERLLVLIPLSGTETSVRVTLPSGPFMDTPEGTLLFEAKLEP